MTNTVPFPALTDTPTSTNPSYVNDITPVIQTANSHTSAKVYSKLLLELEAMKSFFMAEIFETKNKIKFSDIVMNTEDNLKCYNDLITQSLQNISISQDKILHKKLFLSFH